MMLTIRKAKDEDFDSIWTIFHEVVKGGDTYVFDPATSYEEAKKIWMGEGITTYVAEENQEILGTYIIKQNQPGLGSHIAGASFMVHPEKHGRGVGKQIAEHALKEAKSMGFLAMQFNIVIASNLPALKLWEKMGFNIIGTIPGAFNHQKLGYTDAHILYRKL